MKAKPRKKNNKHADEIQAAADYGIDIPLLLNNIRKTPTERIRQHQIALNTAEKLRRSKQL
jgi:hypothetical protein